MGSVNEAEGDEGAQDGGGCSAVSRRPAVMKFKPLAAGSLSYALLAPRDGTMGGALTLKRQPVKGSPWRYLKRISDGVTAHLIRLSTVARELQTSWIAQR